MRKKNLVIILPIYQEKFTEDEKISLKKLRKNLFPNYEICIITHKGLTNKIKNEPLLKGYKLKLFDKKVFTYQGYNKLLKSSFFYSRFKNFSYMLIYQTDCLVFGKNLKFWIDKDYDYVGSPWGEKDKKGNFKFSKVGNGGLSLRKVNSFLEISHKYEQLSWKIKIFFLNIIPSTKILFHKFLITRDYPKYHIGSRNEDLFWSYISKKIKPSFKIAKLEDALKFSFEKYPSFCFKENKNNLPFGCHAWNKYDRKFWEKFI